MEPGISDIPYEVFHKILEEVDYPAIKRICDTNREFRELCATPYFKELINRKRREYLSEKEEYTDRLYSATVDGNLEEVKALVELGVDVNPEGMRISPLLNALKQENLDIVEYLVEVGADLDNKSSLLRGRTALIMAVRQGNEELAQLFLEKGANPNVRDDVGLTALHWAAAEAGEGMVELLLENGADPTVRDGLGETALDIAMSEGNLENASILREAIAAYSE